MGKANGMEAATERTKHAFEIVIYMFIFNSCSIIRTI